ncbi:MAG: ABC transporter substrate-binding protein [candidate division Zixibacteria bacterium RBG_16_53_22]|nr:MAG: ABC transporter substrate-binding protein [candidate division Zixibacteria bacterium RBG_16_53_22]
MDVSKITRILVVALLACGLAVSAAAQTSVRIGGVMTLEGPFTVLGQEAVRAMEMAFEEVNYSVAGKRIEWIKESSDGRPDVAVGKARKLIEQDKVDILIGPMSGGEGLAIKEYAKSVPGKTILNGFSAAQETTLVNPAPNFFRFGTDGAQWQAGLGSYVYDVKGYRTAAVVAGDYSFGYTQVLGFMTEFCAKGGKVKEKIWVPMGTKDFSSAIARIPDKVDAVYVMFGGADSVNFLTQYFQAGGKIPIIGGSNVTEQTVLSTKGPFQRHIIGIPSAHMVADGIEDPAYLEYVAKYKKRFPDGLAAPSAPFYGYYVATKAALTALAQVGGDLGGNQGKFREALAKLKLDTPTGPVILDENRQAIANIFVTEVAQRPDGTLYTKVVKVMRNVNQTLGQPRDAFVARGVPSRDNPSCP